MNKIQSKESNEKRRKTMLKTIAEHPELLTTWKAAALGNKSRTGLPHKTKGKTWDEVYGQEKANEMRKNLSLSQKNKVVSESTKQKQSIARKRFFERCPPKRGYKLSPEQSASRNIKILQTKEINGTLHRGYATTESANKAWETRRKNGRDKPSVESNLKRRNTMLKVASTNLEWRTACLRAAKGNKSRTGMSHALTGTTYEKRYGKEYADRRRENMACGQAKRCKKNTDIELKLKSMMNDAGIKFLFQIPMYGTVVDFYFPEAKTVLFADGCYWHGHSCPQNPYYPNLTERQLRQIEKDKKVNERLVASNHRVVRLWGCEIDKLDTQTFVRRLDNGVIFKTW